MSRRIETDKDSVPDGYYIESHGATYTIYKSDTDNPVSLSYHEIDFPKVKIGAHITTLIEKNGYFVPRELRPTIDKYKGKSDIQKEIVKISKHSITDGMTQKFIAKFNQTSEDQNKSNSNNSIFPRGTTDQQDNKDDKEDTEKNKDEKNDKEEIKLNKNKYILILSAIVTGVLKENSNDWYIITSYDKIDPHKLQQIQNIDDIRELEHPFQITDSDIKRIREYTDDTDKLDRNNLLQELY